MSIESLVGRSPLRDIVVRSCKVGTGLNTNKPFTTDTK